MNRPVNDKVVAHFFPKEGASFAPDDAQYLLSSKGGREDIPLPKTAGLFNGTDNNIVVGDTTRNIGTQATIVCDLNFTAITGNPAIVRPLSLNEVGDNESFNFGLYYEQAGNTLGVTVSNSISGTATFTPVAGVWHRVIITYNSITTNHHLYIDDAVTPVDTLVSGVAPTFDGEFIIGGQVLSAVPYFFGGKMSNIIVYNKELSLSERETIYKGESVERAISQYYVEENDSSVAYDVVAGNHGAINGDLSNFWYEGADVFFNFANRFGYNKSVDTIIPAKRIKAFSEIPYFNNLTSQVKIPTSPDFNFGDGVTNTPFTIYAKFNVDEFGAGTTKYFIQRGNMEGQERGFQFGGTPTSFGFGYYDGLIWVHQMFGSISNPNGKNFWLFATSDGTETLSSGMQIYLFDDDGVHINTIIGSNTTVTGPMEVYTTDLFLGDDSGGAGFKIHDAGIYPSVLSLSDAQAIVNGNPPAGAIARWKPIGNTLNILDLENSHDGVATDIGQEFSPPPTLDALDNPLLQIGQVRERAKIINVNVGIMDGVNTIQFSPFIVGFTFTNGGTATSVAIDGAGLLTAGAGTIFDLKIFDGATLVNHYSFNEGTGTVVNDLIASNNGTWVGHTNPNQWGKSNDAIDYTLRAAKGFIDTDSNIDFNPYASMNENLPVNYDFEGLVDADALLYINRVDGSSLKDFLIYSSLLETASPIRRLYAYESEPVGALNQLEDYEATAVDKLIRNERAI